MLREEAGQHATASAVPAQCQCHRVAQAPGGRRSTQVLRVAQPQQAKVRGPPVQRPGELPSGVPSVYMGRDVVLGKAFDRLAEVRQRVKVVRRSIHVRRPGSATPGRGPPAARSRRQRKRPPRRAWRRRHVRASWIRSPARCRRDARLALQQPGSPPPCH